MTEAATRIETETDVFSHAGHHAFETFIAILHAQDRLETVPDVYDPNPDDPLLDIKYSLEYALDHAMSAHRVLIEDQP
jgi:hypothetical protein